MARYHEVAASLRERIQGGEFPIGSRLPPISKLQGEYDVSGLNTIREAQQRLVREGLLHTQQGVGAFVISTTPLQEATDVLRSLESARSELTRAITALTESEIAAGPIAPPPDLLLTFWSKVFEEFAGFSISTELHTDGDETADAPYVKLVMRGATPEQRDQFLRLWSQTRTGLNLVVDLEDPDG